MAATAPAHVGLACSRSLHRISPSSHFRPEIQYLCCCQYSATSSCKTAWASCSRPAPSASANLNNLCWISSAIWPFCNFSYRTRRRASTRACRSGRRRAAASSAGRRALRSCIGVPLPRRSWQSLHRLLGRAALFGQSIHCPRPPAFGTPHTLPVLSRDSYDARALAGTMAGAGTGLLTWALMACSSNDWSGTGGTAGTVGKQ
mmetsp:Transcript_148943/g.211570  ORF Transcript_148943/g.211570 Transcript_148943/m.211570 type:complete len:203 (-) Transcript_148943:206-814(-)